MKTALSLMVLILALSGCVSLNPHADAPGVVYYVLDDTGPAASPAPPAQTAQTAQADIPTLQVLDTTAAAFYDSDRLVFSRSPDTRGQYQFARWTERPGKRFAELLRARLDRLGPYRITSAGGYVRSDFMLDTRLVEFYHDATREPGQVRLELRAELVDLKQRTLLGRRIFEQHVPLTTYDAAGAAQASSLAVSRVLDDLDAWLATFK